MAAMCCRAEDLTLWYSRPAAEWTEALPVGNSRMGAMVYGGTGKETIQFNEETFWSGSPYNNDSPSSSTKRPSGAARLTTTTAPGHWQPCPKCAA